MCAEFCYDDCASKFGASSYLCDCTKHAKCTAACPSNCNSSDFDTTTTGTCLSECMKAQDDMLACVTLCDKCVVQYGCWSETGGYMEHSEDQCWDECYDDCTT
jgi:hypothetical protein